MNKMDVNSLIACLPIHAVAVICIVFVAAVLDRDVSIYLKASAIGKMIETCGFFFCVFVSKCCPKLLIMKCYLPVLVRPVYLML